MTLKEAYPDRGSSQELQEYLDFVENTREKNGRGEDDHMPKSTHHIIPRSLFKYRKTEKQDDSDRNTVALTHMEHIKAHILLLKYYESTKRTDEEVQAMRMKMANALYATMNFQTTLWSLLDKDILTEGDREYLRTVLYKCRKEYGIGSKVKCYHKTTGKKILVDKSEGIPEGYVEDYRKVDYRKYYECNINGIIYRKTQYEWADYFGIKLGNFKARLRKYGSVQSIFDNLDTINKNIYSNKENPFYYENTEEKMEYLEKHGKKKFKAHYKCSEHQYIRFREVVKNGSTPKCRDEKSFIYETYHGIRMTKKNWLKCLCVSKWSFDEYRRRHRLGVFKTIDHYVKSKNLSLKYIKEFYAGTIKN